MSEDIFGIGLESSCDETSASIVRNGREILSNIIYSQIEIHRDYYGVVPEIASRAHLERINTLIDRALEESGIGWEDLNYVASTNRPGLVGSLLIGLQSAKAISYWCGIPLVAVNHLEAHLYAPFLEGYDLRYPYIGLLVSGGNTVLYYVKGTADLELLGHTVDDAAGEAFDKVAKYLDLGYPGGPVIEEEAAKAVKKEMLFPKIMTDRGDRRFSYSGLKTAVINYIRNNPGVDTSELVYSFQERALELLVRRVYSAAREKGIKEIVVAGGVASNGRLREMLSEEKSADEILIIPSPVLCTDNAAMIAGIGYQYHAGNIHHSMEIDVSSKSNFI